jgi:hypothetical protein
MDVVDEVDEVDEVDPSATLSFLHTANGKSSTKSTQSTSSTVLISRLACETGAAYPSRNGENATMLALCLALLTTLAADDLAPRMQTLEKHYERLLAIPVTEEFAAERDAQLGPLREALDAGAETGEEVNQRYREMDAVRQWLLQHATERPAMEAGAFEANDESWSLDNGVLRLIIQRKDLAMSVETGGAAWEFAPCDDRDIRAGMRGTGLLDAKTINAEPFRTSYSTGILITLGDFEEHEGLQLILGLHLEGARLRCSVMAPGDTMAFDFIAWPKPLKTENTADYVAVVPHMQGMLLPGGFTQAIERQELAHSRTLYLPWWGQLHGSAGVLTILESSMDGGVGIQHPSGGATLIEPLWYSAMGKVGYQRWIRYEFQQEASYVTLAKAYRRYVQEDGRFVSLREKLVRTPALERVIGHPVVHTAGLYHNVETSNYFNKEVLEANHELQTFAEVAEQFRALEKTGLDPYVHLDGWGFHGYDSGHPDVTPAGYEQGGWDGLRELADVCDEFGWVFAVHDQYRDFYKNAASFDYALAKLMPGGDYEEHSVWCGGPQTILSAVHAPGYVRRNHDAFRAHGIKVRGAYLDVFAVVPLEESHHPHHPMTRTECLQYRTNCFDLLRARGYVVSSEEPTDCFVPALDLVHHGPYFVFNEEKRTGIPVPLFGLVYHDSILLPWDMGDAGGWGIPEGDAGRLHCLLNAGLPYVGIAPGEEEIARVNEAAALAKHCAHLEMTSHEFLDDTMRKQRTTYSDGTIVTVDFDTKEYAIAYGGGE